MTVGDLVVYPSVVTTVAVGALYAARCNPEWWQVVGLMAVVGFLSIFGFKSILFRLFRDQPSL